MARLGTLRQTVWRHSRVGKNAEQSIRRYSSALSEEIMLTFLGTSASTPTLTRNTTALAVRRGRDVYLFDCGEATQHNIMKSDVKLSRMSKIFISHMHGDHIFGLPGLLCGLGATGADKDSMRVDVYGPPSIAHFIDVSLGTSQTRYPLEVNVHEMVWEGHGWDPAAHMCAQVRRHEIPCEDESRRVWKLHDDNEFSVIAIGIRHTVPSWGYVLTEKGRRGKSLGVEHPLHFRSLANGQAITLESGTKVEPASVLGPRRAGRKIVILGDTSDPSRVIPWAEGADVVVHEATSLDEDRAKVISRGHSTAGMAAEFAKAVNAKVLLLTHLSAKITQNDKEHKLAAVKSEAASIFKGEVLVVRDLQEELFVRSDLISRRKKPNLLKSLGRVGYATQSEIENAIWASDHKLNS